MFVRGILLNLLCGSMLAASWSATADTVFIRDTVYVPLRGGQSSEHRILHRGLKSGTPLERLVTNPESGYTRVRTEGGLEGWIQTQYLVEEPIAADRLAPVQKQVETLEAEHQQTLLRLREARDSLTAKTRQYEELQQEYTDLQALAGNVVTINDDNARLQQEMEDMAGQIALVRAQSSALEQSTSRDWFLAGGGTVIVSLLFGFWVARRIYQKRNTGGWA